MVVYYSVWLLLSVCRKMCIRQVCSPELVACMYMQLVVLTYSLIYSSPRNTYLLIPLRKHAHILSLGSALNHLTLVLAVFKCFVSAVAFFHHSKVQCSVELLMMRLYSNKSSHSIRMEMPKNHQIFRIP